MKFFRAVMEAEERRAIFLTAISGVFLLLSIATDVAPLGIDPAWGAILISGAPVIYNSFYKLIFHGNVRAGLLISIAVIACVAVGEFFAAGEVVFIMAIGGLLEDYTVRRSKAGLKSLMNMKPATARVQRNGEYAVIAAKDVVAGDIVRIIAGETIPVDGVVIEGATNVDQALMTGESVPVDKVAGDEVYSATTNIHGSILVRATKVGADSTIARMIAMISEAENKKAPIVRTMDKWASYLVVVALVLSVVVGFATGDIIRAITVLVVFCPCALVLATPTAIAAGIGNATKHGVIIKSGAALEQLTHVKRIVFDKTGTLTHGEPKVKEIFLAEGSSLTEEEFLHLCASVEMHSEHPLGMAIVKAAKNRNIAVREPEKFTVLPGKGVDAVVQGKEVIIGNRSILNDHGLSLDPVFADLVTRQNEEGRSVVFAAIEQKVVGALALADTLRPDAKEIVERLAGFRKKLTLLTGDAQAIAAKISQQVGIADYRANLLPEGKMQAIEEYEGSGERVCMVGDGINDAPALKTASIGIAMAGIGSDIAADAADIILVKDELAKLPYIMALATAVSQKIKQNIILSLSMNFGAIALAALGILGPVSGALMHNVSSVLVVLNAALLLKGVKETKDQKQTSFEPRPAYLEEVP
ncbi:copper-(or silver)-translocating P-type ATPase [Geoalkalibacter ferrihydriticus]|uniref:P-type Zn(2+) transporter n=1 Tax=Geoalkalibacter ferrihydriticus TaxID=392333 RepID=A0A1G9LWZ1_9BACT|nr:cation-translocating P-type ATPase [Geoalkalibacter ferrihydriticus]SDL66478.1 copper-(or silver)-translocating P-type ATPase [Geoalkalibacter ferrihydriticus]